MEGTIMVVRIKSLIFIFSLLSVNATIAQTGIHFDVKDLASYAKVLTGQNLNSKIAPIPFIDMDCDKSVKELPRYEKELLSAGVDIKLSKREEEKLKESQEKGKDIFPTEYKCSRFNRDLGFLISDGESLVERAEIYGRWIPLYGANKYERKDVQQSAQYINKFLESAAKFVNTFRYEAGLLSTPCNSADHNHEMRGLRSIMARLIASNPIMIMKEFKDEKLDDFAGFWKQMQIAIVDERYALPQWSIWGNEEAVAYDRYGKYSVASKIERAQANGVALVLKSLDERLASTNNLEVIRASITSAANNLGDLYWGTFYAQKEVKDQATADHFARERFVNHFFESILTTTSGGLVKIGMLLNSKTGFLARAIVSQALKETGVNLEQFDNTKSLLKHLQKKNRKIGSIRDLIYKMEFPPLPAVTADFSESEAIAYMDIQKSNFLRQFELNASLYN